MDNHNPNLYKKESQLAFAMGVFETKYTYEIGDDDEMFDEFLTRLYEIGEYNIHHKAWIDELTRKVYDEDGYINRDSDLNLFEEYENAVEKFKQIEDYIQRGCIAI